MTATFTGLASRPVAEPLQALQVPAAEPLGDQCDRVEAAINRILATLSGMTHSPKCERPGATVEHGTATVTTDCDGCGATTTTTRKKA
jgi:hypothetical protein